MWGSHYLLPPWAGVFAQPVTLQPHAIACDSVQGVGVGVGSRPLQIQCPGGTKGTKGERDLTIQRKGEPA